MRFLRNLFLFLLIICAQLSYAEISDEGCLPYTIVFGNGVGNSRDDALKSRRILSDLIGSKFRDKDVNYETAFNPRLSYGLSREYCVTCLCRI